MPGRMLRALQEAEEIIRSREVDHRCGLVGHGVWASSLGVGNGRLILWLGSWALGPCLVRVRDYRRELDESLRQNHEIKSRCVALALGEVKPDNPNRSLREMERAEAVGCRSRKCKQHRSWPFSPTLRP